MQEKQNEARYLRDHKEELIEELATTIVQKVRVQSSPTPFDSLTDEIETLKMTVNALSNFP